MNNQLDVTFFCSLFSYRGAARLRAVRRGAGLQIMRFNLALLLDRLSLRSEGPSRPTLTVSS
jgi:hypothetical protein